MFAFQIMKIMLRNLEEQEKALTEMFSGYTERTEKSFTFYVEPTQEIKDQVSSHKQTLE